MNKQGSAAAAIHQAVAAERAGQVDTALYWLEQASSSEGHDPTLQRFVAHAALRLGNATLALAAMARAVELAPNDDELRFQFACLLAHQGRHVEAVVHFRASLLAQPQNAEGRRLLGVTLQRLGRHAEALAPLREAHALAPGHVRILETLAESEFHAGYPDDALPLLQALNDARPGEPRTALRLAETFNRLGRHEEARALLASAAITAEDPSDVLVALAQTAEDQGDRDAARQAYHDALLVRPGWAFPLSGLLGLDRAKADDTLVEHAERLLDDPALPDPDRALLGYELGKVMDGRKRYTDAMQCWRQANDARQRMVGPANLDTFGRQIVTMMETLTAERLQAIHGRWPGNPDPRPLFIVGMPRSGTTLTEQILAAHPSGFGCGELPDIGLIVRNLPGSIGPGATWPECVETLSHDALEAASQRYLRAATRGAPEHALRLVDKLPLNFHELGLISLLFPNARIVWCRRDPRDIAVSVYSENFALEERLANDLGAIGHYINFQTRLMRHWQNSVPLPILELTYEDLARDPEPWARTIIDFAGLPWDPACLEFHQNERGVQTPSRWQVKQPIYTRSIGRWRHYEAYLGPLLDVLEPDTYPAMSDGPATQAQPTMPSA
ncbi:MULTISPECIES: tetratricopeptide repeat-containing sulfotransferase family protein [unclassified Pseudoxanthomonas]|uniref:tetratricopeptide repeat-containing sulfotransferase family protein n=1 Tax=unclassified Pseudoxanthomonas TaxID=2645906 RepID=UPI0008DF8B11|nr:MULTISPECIES: tetratricopeptide repeat-containing sulfotransferase family protein [unclassified Pseudoxanthomonas]PPJ43359.1 sulfotransferase family protein [Pseudoxanthomonas sp. KAs_5_3]SFV34964.1 Flp pilus assembly protein TadD, contains TPR repeats [Pseudoxanthomonas sp. YR558]